MRRLTFLLATLFAGLLAACTPDPQWHGTDVTGALPDLEFDLIDGDGAQVTGQSFRGRPVLLFFGFTNCPGPCPTTLSRIGVVLEKVPDDRGREVQVLLVTVDPQRDTPDALARYVTSFGPWLTGLTGSGSELDTVKQAYKVHAQRLLADASGNYDVSHSTVVLAFDRQGRCRLLYSDLDDMEAVARDLDRLIRE